MKKKMTCPKKKSGKCLARGTDCLHSVKHIERNSCYMFTDSNVLKSHYAQNGCPRCEEVKDAKN